MKEGTDKIKKKKKIKGLLPIGCMFGDNGRNKITGLIFKIYVKMNLAYKD